VSGRQVSRKQLLRVGAVIGVGSLGAGVLAGCRNGESASTLSTIEESGGRVPEAAPRQTAIAAVSDVAPNSAVSLHELRKRAAGGARASPRWEIRGVLGGVFSPGLHCGIPTADSKARMSVPRRGIRLGASAMARGRSPAVECPSGGKDRPRLDAKGSEEASLGFGEGATAKRSVSLKALARSCGDPAPHSGPTDASILPQVGGEVAG
jgi:hypothetical protein